MKYNEQKQLPEAGFEQESKCLRTNCHSILNECTLNVLYNIGNRVGNNEETKNAEAAGQNEIYQDLQEIYQSNQFIQPDSQKIIKFNLPEDVVSLQNILIVISLQILRKGKMHKNLVTIGQIVRLTNLNGQNLYKLGEVKQKYYHLNQEFEVNEVFKVDGLEMNERSVDESARTYKNQEEMDCVVCFSNPKDVILLPCRHFCVC